MPDFSFMWWRRNLFLLSGKHEYTGMLLTTNNVKWWCSSSASKSFLNPVKCICFWSFQLFNTLKYPYTEVYINFWRFGISLRWQMKSGVKDSQGRLPMHRYYSYCAERKKERESSQPLFAVAYMWPKKLWWCGTKSFQISFGQKSFFFYFNFLVFHLLSYYVIVLRSQYLSSCQSIDEEARSHIRKL